VRNHLAVQKGPAWLAMQQEHGLAVRRSFVEVVDPEPTSVAGIDFHVVGCEWEVGQVDESFVRRTQDVHDVLRS
jgi:hypothetical protein